MSCYQSVYNLISIKSERENNEKYFLDSAAMRYVETRFFFGFNEIHNFSYVFFSWKQKSFGDEGVGIR